MLSLPVMFTAVLLGVATAQNNSLSIPPSVDQSEKATWCIAESNACRVLCGASNIEKNQCLTPELPQYDCICGDGNPPDNIDQYVGTIPNSICVAQFADCRQKTPGSKNCPNCGKLVPSQVAQAAPSSTSSSSSSSTSAPSSTSASATAATSTNAAAGYGGEMGGVVVGIAAAMGMLL